jgi:hypothetical protein
MLLLTAGLIQCNNPEPLSNKADGAIIGNVLPGEAAGTSGPIYVVASRTSDRNAINWTRQNDVLPSHGAFRIEELVEGKYYIAIFRDENRNGAPDSGEPFGGYDANGDGILDPVSLIGGKTVQVDVTFFTTF